MTQLTSDQRRPFLSAPSPKRYFAAAPIEEARQRIVRAIARSEGPAILVGGAGTGKSLLLAVLAEQFGPRMSVVTLMGAQLCTRRALLQMILCEMGLPYRGMDEGELRLAILQHLRGGQPRRDASPPASPGPRRLLLLVDEADTLPIRLLEELRVLTNVAADGLPLVSLVLAGGPILEERFADPQLDLFAQRVAARCYLAPLVREETLQFVRAQVAAVGVRPDSLFTPDALEAIHSATGGVPRLVNQLGDQLAWMAEETGCAPLDATLVQQAWSDLQQLPAPWNGHSDADLHEPADGGVIEFGELDAGDEACDLQTLDDEPAAVDDEDEMPASIPIASARAVFGAVDDVELDDTLDLTERLLESYDGDLCFPKIDLAELARMTEDPADPPAAENPFDEPFEEEEIVVDPYRAFEADILRTAPHVVNRLDRAFANELHRYVQRASITLSAPPPAPNPAGAATSVTASTPPGAATPPAASIPSPAIIAAEAPNPLTATIPPAPPRPTAAPAPTSPIVWPHASLCDSPLAELATNQVRLHQAAPPLPTTAPTPPTSDLLIVEEDDQPAAKLVQGRQFRRLFSDLEAASTRTKMG